MSNKKLSIKLPKETLVQYGIDDNTALCVYFHSGMLVVETLPESDISDSGDLLFEEETYEDGYAEGRLSGYSHGYLCGFYDATSGFPYDDSLTDLCEARRRPEFRSI